MTRCSRYDTCPYASALSSICTKDEGLYMAMGKMCGSYGDGQ